MAEVRDRIAHELPELRTYFQSGGLVDAVLNQGVPAPIDVQVSGIDMRTDNNLAQNLARQFKAIRGVSDVYIPQDMDYPGLQIDVNRTRAAELGLDPKEVIDNIITSLTSDAMIAPSYWVDPRSGNNYFVTVQYPENQVTNLESLKTMPLRAPNLKTPTYLDQVADVTQILSPTEVDHYQLERDFDIYVAPTGEDLGKLSTAISKIIADTKLPPNIRIDLRGLVVTMNESFRSFGVGLFLAIVLVYLILVAQFKSFIDPFLIVLAVPTGIVGVILTLVLTGTTLNIQSLMGIVMLQGMVVSNSILIVDFANVLRGEGHTLSRSRSPRLPHPPSSDSYDLAGDGGRLAAHGFQARSRERSLCSAGSCDYRRPALLHRADDFRGPRRIPADLSPSRSVPGSKGTWGGPMRIAFRLVVFVAALALISTAASAQTVQTFTLQQAEQLAIQNHPQIQVADCRGFGGRRAEAPGAGELFPNG